MACRTSKINTVVTATVDVLIPKYIYGQYLCEQANASTAMWKLWHAGLQKNTVFTTTLAVLVPKYIYDEYLCEQTNLGTAIWKLCRAGFEK